MNNFKYKIEYLEDICVINTQGKRSYNEDTYLFFIENNNILGAIFDGHGGMEISEYCKNNFLEIFKKIKNKKYEYYKNIENYADIKDYTTIEIYIKEIIKQFDVNEIFNLNSNNVGSTMICFILLDDLLIFINLGDSSLIFSYYNNNKKMYFKPIIHNIHNVKEQNRILTSNSNIINDRIDGIINVTRTFGDFKFKNKYNNISAISNECDVYIFNISKIKPGFILLGSDGIFDVIHYNIIYKYISFLLSINMNVCDILKNILFYTLYIKKSQDNITILLYVFKRKLNKNNIDLYNYNINIIKRKLIKYKEVFNNNCNYHNHKYCYKCLIHYLNKKKNINININIIMIEIFKILNYEI